MTATDEKKKVEERFERIRLAALMDLQDIKSRLELLMNEVERKIGGYRKEEEQ